MDAGQSSVPAKTKILSDKFDCYNYIYAVNAFAGLHVRLICPLQQQGAV
jgi:hypothetical protein